MTSQRARALRVWVNVWVIFLLVVINVAPICAWQVSDDSVLQRATPYFINQNFVQLDNLLLRGVRRKYRDE